jgi:molybdopterin synthase sulfur carrier subunit
VALVRIPTPLRRLTGGQAEVAAEGETVAAVIDDLEAKHPGMKARICDENGNIRRFVNIYLNNEDVRFLNGKETKVGPNDEVSIIPAIAGGTIPPKG